MNARIARVLGMILCLGNAAAFGAVVDWNGSEGDWNTASNWTIQEAGGNKVPADGDTANVAAGIATSVSLFNATNRIYNLSESGKIVIGGSDFTLHTNTVVNQSGGTLTMTHARDQWLNIGENSGSRSTYNMTGGDINLPLANSYLVVGRRGPGDMTVSGDSTISINTFEIGYCTLLSGDSTMNLNGGTLTVRGDSHIGGASADNKTAISNSGTSTFNIAGGTYTSQGSVNIGNYFDGMNSISGVAVKTVVNMTSGIWTAENAVNLGARNAVGGGNSNTVNVNLSGGTSTFKKRFHIGAQANTDATLTISEAAIVTFEDNLYVGANNQARANFNLTGGNVTFLGEVSVESGTFTSSVDSLSFAGATTSRLNVGHLNGGTGVFKVAAGTVNVNVNKADIQSEGEWMVGKNRGTGILEVAGSGTLNINHANWGFRLGNSTGSTGELRISDSANVVLTGNDVYIGVDGGRGIITQTGGTLTANCWLNIGERGTGEYTLSGGTLNANNYLCVGRYGPGTMTVSGTGKVVAASDLCIGMFPATSGVSTLNIQSKENTVAGVLYVGGGGSGQAPAEGSCGILNIESGDLSVMGYVHVGHASAGVLTLRNGGTIHASDPDFLVGSNNKSGKVVIENGGTYDQAGKGNFVVRSTTATDAGGNKVGSIVELQAGGTLDTLWLSLGQGGWDGGTCNFYMTGGTLKIGNATNNTFHIGHEYDGNVTISGGSVYTSGPVALAKGDMATNSSLNVLGSQSTWDVNTLDFDAKGTFNVTADVLTVDKDGRLAGGVSTLKARGSASILSTVKIDMTGAVYDGVAFLSAAPTLTLISSTGLTWNPANLELKGGAWELNVTGTNAELFLDDANFAAPDGSGVMGGAMELGWAKTDRNTVRFYYGDGVDASGLAAWLQEQLPEANAGVKVADLGSFIEFSNIPLNAEGFAYVPFSLAAYNAAHGTDFEFSNLPEPAAWAMFGLGAALLVFWRRKRS